MNAPAGFNLVGYATSPMGLGEDLRTFAAMLEHLGIPFSVTDVPTDVQGQLQVSWSNMTTQDYATSIFFMAALECERLLRQHPQLLTQVRRKVGYFLWELPDLPPEHLPALQLMDHIWCPTRFVQQSFFSKSRQLTLALPLPVVQPAPSGLHFRRQLKIPAKAFVCLFIFDLHSTLKRKNPQAVLRVFLAMAEHCPDAYLILKVSRWQNLGTVALDWIPHHPRIKVLKDTLAPGELTDLYQSANCYLSLHRSEGFGRTLVEALQNGLHLVCTDFSGPKDFVTSGNTLLVNWERVAVDAHEYPNLTIKSWWAQADEVHALQQVLEARQRARLGRNRAGLELIAQFSYEGLAKKYKPVLQTYLS
jgi:glycosyltransferase involved in cell wall biosynthesis